MCDGELEADLTFKIFTAIIGWLQNDSPAERATMSAPECRTSDRFLFVIYWTGTCGIFNSACRYHTKSELAVEKSQPKSQFVAKYHNDIIQTS